MTFSHFGTSHFAVQLAFALVSRRMDQREIRSVGLIIRVWSLLCSAHGLHGFTR